MRLHIVRKPWLAPAYAAAVLYMLSVSFTTARAADLQEVYSKARDYDATIQVARHDYEAAQQLLPVAKSAFRPQINAGLDASLTDINDDRSKTFPSTQLQLSISQSLFNKANWALIDQAQIGVLQAGARFQAAQQNLILRVANAYFDVLRAQANVEFSQSELQAIDRQREQAERRFDVGLVPITDVRTAQAQYDLAVAQEIAASNRLSAAHEALLLVSGVNPDQLAVLAEDLPLVSPDPVDIDAWVTLAQDQNLDLTVARLASESAQQQVTAERGARYPTFNALALASSLDTEQESGRDLDRGELRLEVNLPLLTGGRTKALIAQAQAQSLSAAEQLVNQERATTQQARVAYRDVIATISQVRALRQALVSTKKSAEATDAGFRAGTRTSVDVLRALRDIFRARSDYANARYDYIINTLNLKSAAGTLTEDDLLAINKFLAPAE